MRRFHLQRDVDLTGVSGAGTVAEGVQFADGSCALRWLTATASTAIYASIGDLEAIHGHGGRTRVVWQDPAPARAAVAPERVELVLRSAVPPTGAAALSRRAAIIAKLRGATS